ncbi:MAG: DUF3280 domain-containing protein [Rhizobiaceae bacterium]|nr:DUF3280 domain-containing protein [Rhizobiaceae bacterium]
MRLQGGLFPVFLAATISGHAVAAEKTVAVFDFELIDTSLEGQMKGVNPAETARLGTMAPQLRVLVAGEPDLAVLDVGPVREKSLERSLRKCEPCALDLGRELGADIVVTGTVQKVSNLILNINAYGHEVKTGTLVSQGSADIRGNNDEMWTRGLDALWKNTLKKQFQAVEAAR